MTALPHWQVALFGMCVACVIAVQFIFALTLNQQILLIAPLVAILGLPHGALDLPIAQALWPLDTRSAKLQFFAIYIGLVCVVIVLWVLFPGPALIAFLGYSILHFSDDWAAATPPLRWTGGFATIGGVSLFHTTEVALIFSYLAPDAFALTAAKTLAILGAVSLMTFITALILRPANRTQAALEQVLIWVAAFALPPLLFFIVYFCSLHSVRHFTQTLQSVPNTGQALVISAVLSCAVVAIAGMVWLLLPQTSVKLSLQIVFIGLAALTVPHMLLVDRLHRQV